MLRFKQSLVAFFGLLALAILVALVTPRTGLGQGGAKQPQPLSVNVTNTEAAPVPVRDVDSPGRQRFSSRVVISIPGNGILVSDHYVVPAGKRLVLEDVSAGVHIPQGYRAHFSILRSTPGGDNALRHLTLTYQFTQASIDLLVAGEPVRMYFEPGDKLGYIINLSGNVGNTSVDLTLSGYLVDAPPAQ